MNIFVVLYHNSDERDAFPVAAFHTQDEAEDYAEFQDGLQEDWHDDSEWHTVHEIGLVGVSNG